MTRLIRSACAAALLAVVAPPGSAAGLKVPCVADTYFQAYGSEDTNYGNAPVLKIDQWDGRKAFLRFAITPDQIPRDKHIVRASLRLYVTEVGWNEAGEMPDLKTGLGLWDVVTPWTETGLTFKTSDGQHPWSQGAGIHGGAYADVGPTPKPDVGVLLRKGNIPFAGRDAVQGKWLDLDLTDYLRGRIRAGAKEVDLMVTSSMLARNYTFASRENPDASLRPYLAVDIADATPEFSLGDAFATDWAPGRAVGVPVRSAAGLALARAKWTFDRLPGGSKLTGAAVKAAAGRATFTPDAPGLYRVRCEMPGGGSETADVFAFSVRKHPRLYLTPERIARLRKQYKVGERLVKAFMARVDSQDQGLPKGQYSEFGAYEGAEDNGLAYQITGDPKYADASIAYANLVMKKPMPENFEDSHGATFLGGNWVHGMMCHYDWCYDRLTPEHRKAVAQWLEYAADWSYARSGAPIAHNDGGARQMLLSAPGFALLGDDPEALTYLRRALANFDDGLLPWLNDGGRGGRSGDGGEYEGLHGFYIVRFAALSRCATGEDVFSESPYFRNRLNHILFGWYPRKLVERHGQFAMREYYSPSGDHTRMGFVGDTQPYQSAALLCDRYRTTPEAQGVRWLAGDWPTQWMQYCLRWAVLGDFDEVPAREPTALAYLDKGFSTMYARSDWSDDATWVLFENGPYVSVHQSLDKGGFEIFKGDILAARTGNMDYANVSAPHTLNYLHRTISTNGLLIEDPNEKWKGFIGGETGAPDEGGERTNWPLTSGPDASTYVANRSVFQRGEVTRYANNPDVTYALADITDAYNNPSFHGGELNKPKVTSVTRQLMYVRGLDSVVVFDRVSSTDPAYKKRWILHSLGELDVQGGEAEKVDDGEFHYTGATRAVIHYGWPKPVPSFGRCLSVTLLPEHPSILKIGGRTELPPGKTEGYPGDRWHEQHNHHHLKDFWVAGKNYPVGASPEVRWFGEPTQKDFVPGTPDESGGRGKWRIEVSPSTQERDDVFFHVLCPRLGADGPFPAIERVKADGFEGAAITENGKTMLVFFSPKEATATSFAATVPAGKTALLMVADLQPGKYHVTAGGKPADVTVGEDCLLRLPAASGQIRATKQ